MHNAALTLMNTGDLRDAAEKAWCATKRAADGMITARTGTEPTSSTGTSRGLRQLRETEPAIDALQQHYFARQATLHGACFYYGLCDPIDEVIHLIRETESFIVEAERLAETS